MARERGVGRLVQMAGPEDRGETPGEAGPVPAREPVRMNKASTKRLLAQARRQFWLALPEITEALIAGAKEGQVTHLKLLLELGGLEKGSLGPTAEGKERSVEDELADGWFRHRAEQAAAANNIAASGGVDGV